MGFADGRGGHEERGGTRRARSSSPVVWEGTGDGQSKEAQVRGALPQARWLLTLT